MCRTTTVPRTHKATQQFGAGPLVCGAWGGVKGCSKSRCCYRAPLPGLQEHRGRGAQGAPDRWCHCVVAAPLIGIRAATSQWKGQSCWEHWAGSTLLGEPVFPCSMEQEPGVPRMASQPFCSVRARIPLSWRIRGSLQTQGMVAPRGSSPPPTSHHSTQPQRQEPSSALSPLVLGSCHHSAKKPSS